MRGTIVALRRPRLLTFLALLALGFLGRAAVAAAPGAAGLAPARTHVAAGPPPPIMPLSEVRPGMVGQALTVFQGRKPEPFKVRVVSVLRNFLPKLDVILVRAEDTRLEQSGIAAGMSGSPVYVDGKLIGAVAYGWNFAKEALAGVTPIESMLAERHRPLRAAGLERADAGDGLHSLTLAQGGDEGGEERRSEAGATEASLPATPAALAAAFGGLPPTPGGEGIGSQLRPVAIPLAVAGFDDRTIAEMDRALRPLGLVPVRAGGGGRRADAGPGVVEPGSAIGVELVRGDMSVVGTGTVTYVDKDTVVAFGHPMLGTGELYLPLVDAEIHAILPSLAQSIKLSSPVAEIGGLVQDRKACIVGDLAARVTMVPVTIRVKAPNAAPRVFHAEIARHRRLTPSLLALVANSAIADAEPDPVDMTMDITSRVKLRDRPALALRDEFFSAEGVTASLLASLRGVRAVGELLTNPFQPIVLEQIELDIDLAFRRDLVEIVGTSLRDGRVRAGQTATLDVTLRPYDGREYTETLRVPIPAGLAGQSVKLDVSSGAFARPDIAPPETLTGYLDALTKYYPSSAIVVSVQTQQDGVATRGRLLPDLPSAALDTLRGNGRTRRLDTYRVTDKTVFPTKRIVTGKQELTVAVDGDVLGRKP